MNFFFFPVYPLSDFAECCIQDVLRTSGRRGTKLLYCRLIYCTDNCLQFNLCCNMQYAAIMINAFFTPFVMTADGALGLEAKTFMRHLAEKHCNFA